MVLWISTFAPLALIAPPYKLCMPRRELEQKFEIVLLANESKHQHLPPAPIFVVIEAELRKLCQIKECSVSRPDMEEKSGKFSKDHHSSTYVGSGVGLECGVIDLHNRVIYSMNSSTLEVACPAPGIRVKF
jgi:hypothetical protein